MRGIKNSLDESVNYAEEPENLLRDNIKIERVKVLEPDPNKTLFSLKKMIIAFLIFCWLVPVLVLFITICTSYQKGMISKTRILLEDELSSAAVLISHNFDELIKASKKISYDKILETYYREYRDENITKEEFYKFAASELRVNFNYDKAYRMAMFYLVDEPEQRYPNTIKEREHYTDEVEKAAKEIERINSPKAFLRIIDDKLYMIRNLYTVTGFTKYGVFILELNPDQIFRDVNKNNIYRLAISLDKQESVICMNADETEKTKEMYRDFMNQKFDEEKVARSSLGDKYEGYYMKKVNRDFVLNISLVAERSVVYQELNEISLLLVFIFLVLIPLIAFIAFFFTRQVTTPIQKMTEAYREIRAGKLGVQLEPSWAEVSNQEFSYLMLSFNKMSSKIKYLFDYAYNEQLARKDAQIMALQSQINPHFLNNTLEMMNWQARLSGDINVSKMIEALSTLLNHSMDRSNQRLISLTEELHCADAYFYIVSMRFGQRLVVEKELNSGLLEVKVPQLILQPLLENAVKHGVEKIKKGTIWMKVYETENNIVLQVENTGLPMTEEDVSYVNQLLSGGMPAEDVRGGHLSLGIHNVNERIRLIYGEDYGLKIWPEGEITIASITIPKTNP